MDQQTISVGKRIRLARVKRGVLVGARPWQHDALEATGAKIVGIERGDTVRVEFGAEFRLRPCDVLILCDSDASLLRCARELQTENAPMRG